MQRHPPQRPPPPPPGASSSNSAPPPPPPPSPSYASATTLSESQLPSVKSKFHTIEQERTIRSKTCRFIEEAGRALKLPRLTSSTAMVLFQRFYAVHSFEDHDRFEVAVACILLAAKTEESPKKLTVVIQECHRLKTMSLRKTAGANKSGSASLDVNNAEFKRLKERTLLLERVILHTIGFELSIDHPHKFFGEQIKKLITTKQIEFIKKPTNLTKPIDQMMTAMLKKSISFANDSMQTCLCLQYPSNKIAAAIIYMSALANKMRPTNDRSWFELLPDLDQESLVSIVKQIIELIADRKGVDKNVFLSIEADLNSMKQDHRGGSGGEGERDAKRQRI